MRRPRTRGRGLGVVDLPAVLALAEFRRCGIAEVVFGPATRLTIRVKQPETEHTVSVGKLQAWLDGGGRSPKQIAKSKLKEILKK